MVIGYICIKLQSKTTARLFTILKYDWRYIMSVGVCIINRNGIALAADSAGTYTGNKMFYNSMNKVFSISRKYVYGAITYGSTVIHNVSIDQVLKEFRTFLDSQNEVNDFFDILPSFVEFIEQKNNYYKFDTAETNHCYELIKVLISDWGKKIKNIITTDDVAAQIDNILNDLSAVMQGAIKIENYDVSSYIGTTYKSDFDSLINMIVPELNNYPAQKERFWNYICEYFNLSLTNETSNAMGLFFCGYGKNDAFPKFTHIELYNVVGGKVKYKLIENYEESNNQAQIVPLAQKDVILTFCKGISNTFINYIPQKVESIINAKIDAIPDTFTDSQKGELKEALLSVKNEIASAIDTTIQNSNVMPILNSVQLIPLAEMAFFAENLVNMTTLKRTFAIDGNQQTVGGPTDVAVLSKGDGFVWIKRKLYFDGQLNPNYALRLCEF